MRAIASTKIENSPEAPSIFRTLFKKAGYAVAVLDDSGQYCYANQVAADLTRYDRHELTQLGFKEIVHPEDLPKVQASFKSRFQGKETPSIYLVRIMTKDRQVIPVQLSISTMKWGDKMFSFGIVMDISDTVQTNDQLNKQKQELNLLHRELLETNNALSALARNIDTEKKKVEKKVDKTITIKIMPILNDLLSDPKSKRFWPELAMLGEYLNSISSKGELNKTIIDILTETEMRVAVLVKNDMTSKKIASLMCISIDTVKVHRKNIRRKLDISGSDIKLAAYLKNLLGDK
jgi:PAS domain S-box-containing protein